MLSKVTSDSNPGQIYLIPQFMVKNEHLELIKAFKQIVFSEMFRQIRPKWLKDFKSQLDYINPYKAELERLDRQIKTIESERNEILRKIEETTRLVDLLVETDEELISAARIALEIIGFDCPETVATEPIDTFEILLRGDPIKRAIIRIVDTESGPIQVDEVNKLKNTIESRKLRVKPKGILIGNASHTIPPKERELWFDPKCHDEARLNDFCLMSSFELYAIACYCLSKSDSGIIEEIKSSLMKDIFNCDSLFVMNEKRYST